MFIVKKNFLEDLFTGESALSRNHRGPTGDGYGPLILNGAAIPPVAPETLSYGGAAAGVPIDLQDIQRLTEINPENENQATTVIYFIKLYFILKK